LKYLPKTKTQELFVGTLFNIQYILLSIIIWKNIEST